MSPLRTLRRSSPSKCGYWLPHWWICGASGSNALRMSNSGVRSLVGDVDRGDGLHRLRLALGGDDGDRLALVAHLAVGQQRLVGRDAERRDVAVHVERHVRCVTTAWTPSSASARVVSRRVMAALGCGERSAFAHSVVGTRTSSTYRVPPVTCSDAS